MKSIMYFLDYGKSYGGAAHTLMQQAILMRKNGYKIYIVISNYFGNEMDISYQKICDSYDIHLNKVPFVMTSSPEDINYIEVRNHYSALRQLVEVYMPDILHSVQINVTVELVSRELNIPHIMNIYQAKQSFFPFKYLDIFPRYHICDSVLYMHVWQKNLGCHSCCIRTYAKQIEKKKIKRENLTFLCVGLLCERKNQLEVIKAFEIIYRKGIRAALFLCGDDNNEYGISCRDYVIKNGLSEVVKFEGFCVGIQEYYNNADILVCGSKIESYPNVISEALASDCIVVSTPVGGVPEVIKDRKNGYLCDRFDACSIAEKMETAAHDCYGLEGDLIKRCAKNTYQSNHSEQAVYSALKTYYDHVLADYSQRKREEIKFEELNEIFDYLFKRYNEYVNLILDPGFVSYKLWYLYHFIKALPKELISKNIFLWGNDWVTVVISEMLAVFVPQLQITGFIGDDQNSLFLGRMVYSAETVLSDDDNIVLVATEDKQERIEKVLNSYHKICGKDYFMMAIRMW